VLKIFLIVSQKLIWNCADKWDQFFILGKTSTMMGTVNTIEWECSPPFHNFYFHHGPCIHCALFSFELFLIFSCCLFPSSLITNFQFLTCSLFYLDYFFQIYRHSEINIEPWWRFYSSLDFHVSFFVINFCSSIYVKIFDTFLPPEFCQHFSIILLILFLKSEWFPSTQIEFHHATIRFF
jgi:hypothetical protein